MKLGLLSFLLHLMLEEAYSLSAKGSAIKFDSTTAPPPDVAAEPFSLQITPSEISRFDCGSPPSGFALGADSRFYKQVPVAAGVQVTGRAHEACVSHGTVLAVPWSFSSLQAMEQCEFIIL